jgi:hypothetical protein
MIDRHWDGIAAYCRPENKVSLGFVLGAQQQDPDDPAPRLRLPQRRLPAAQNPHVHAAGPVAVSGIWTIFLTLPVDLSAGHGLVTNPRLV